MAMFGDMDWTFAEIIERCSYGVNIQAGDVIGSGNSGHRLLLRIKWYG
jgi:fumarylacetoacetate (FAA) hydrolase